MYRLLWVTNLVESFRFVADKVHAAGTYEIVFNASSLSSGVYYYQMRTGSKIETRKFVVMK